MKSLNAHMNANIHLVMNSFGTLFHDKIFSLTVNNIPDISLTCFKFPDTCRFSRQVVTLYIPEWLTGDGSWLVMWNKWTDVTGLSCCTLWILNTAATACTHYRRNVWYRQITLLTNHIFSVNNTKQHKNNTNRDSDQSNANNVSTTPLPHAFHDSSSNEMKWN